MSLSFSVLLLTCLTWKLAYSATTNAPPGTRPCGTSVPNTSNNTNRCLDGDYCSVNNVCWGCNECGKSFMPGGNVARNPLEGYCPTRCARWAEFGSSATCSVTCGLGTRASNFLCIDLNGVSYNSACAVPYNGTSCPCRGNPENAAEVTVPCQLPVSSS